MWKLWAASYWSDLIVIVRMAPEVIMCETVKDSPYNYKADIWSFGQLQYISAAH